MKKLIFFASILPYCCYALELHNAVIVDHNSWVSGSGAIEGHIESNPQNTFYSLATNSSATTSASADNAQGIVNHNIYTHGSHGFYVHNTSGTTQRYTVTMKLCANSTSCFNDQKHIDVGKGGYFSESGTSYLACMFSYPGNYSLEATTAISGDTSSQTSGRATITVIK